MINHLEDGFRFVARGCAMSWGFSFTTQCECELMNMIHLGVSRMVEEGVDHDVQSIRTAQQNLVTFVSEMAEIARSQDSSELTEFYFREIFKKHFPKLWPFG